MAHEEMRYLNRDLTWIDFNERVLSEALNPEVPLLERVKFLCIVSMNFDEFFMVRVASLKRQLRSGIRRNCPSGMSVRTQLEEISREVKRVVEIQYKALHEEILPGLAEHGIFLRRPEDMSSSQRAFLRAKFEEEILPALTPVRVETGQPLAYSGNMRLQAAFLLYRDPEASVLGEDVEYGPAGETGPEQLGLTAEGEPAEKIAIVQIPRSVPRIFYLPERDGRVGFALIEHVVIEFAAILFPGYSVQENALFRVTRDADMGVDEERDEDFVEAMEQVLEHREHGDAVRLSVNREAGRIGEVLREAFGLQEADVYRKDEPLELATLMQIYDLPGYDELRYPVWRSYENPALPGDEPIWNVLRTRDVLLHHPYDSFSPVIRLIESAAHDPHVMAIKVTLYRTSGKSPIIQALELAAASGKHVTALVELKARFDEERNIGWAERLANAGVIVVYGIARLKVHSKVLMIVRREKDGVRRYLHLGTGNYNEKTARYYTDTGLMTSREDMAYDVGLFFNAITGYSSIPAIQKLVMAPTGLKSRLLQLIEREAMRSSPDAPGLIMAKMNSLADPDIIEALYAASAKGVRIHLNVRGICTLIPRRKGLSENISVVSILDRYLEHSRLFYFRNGGVEDVYAASADWMPRNLERRVELMFPIEQENLKRKVKHMLEVFCADNVKAHEMNSDGSWRRRVPGPRDARVRAQELFHEEAQAGAEAEEPPHQREFTVRRRPPDEQRR